MMYAVYDSVGRITQGSELFHEEYAKTESIMHDLGQVWVKESRSLVSPDEWYVAKRALTERPVMQISLSTKTIRAGTSDAAVFLGIPKGARCDVASGGNSIYSLAMDDPELEISIPVPCIYRVKFSLWPYRDALFEIEAVQP
ncbi:MAG: hypothetical protein WBB98_04565 [Xanthobacteraceae bacterium]